VEVIVKQGVIVTATVALIVVVVGVIFFRQQGTKKETKPDDVQVTQTVSFSKDVMAIVQEHCLPCHSENEYNPSELFMDSYDLMSQGGKHGVPWVPGKPAESLIIKKVSEDPPFDARMPLNPKKKIAEGKAKWLSADEISIISTWIAQGAKNN
jgi:Planctomycete cytochrome C